MLSKGDDELSRDALSFERKSGSRRIYSTNSRTLEVRKTKKKIFFSNFFFRFRSAHPPPETTSIRLILKLMAMLKQVRLEVLGKLNRISFFFQTENRRNLLEELQKFSQGVSSENQRFYHKLLRKEFQVRFDSIRFFERRTIFLLQSQVEQVRYALEQFNEQFMQIDEFRWFLSGQGFRHLLALLGRNQQGIGTSPLARWVKNCETLSNQSKCVAAAAGPDELSQWIDAIYLKIDEVSGEFLDAEGSGLFRLQSCRKFGSFSKSICFSHFHFDFQ